MSDLYKKLINITKDISLLYVEDEQETLAQYGEAFRLLFKDVKTAQNGEEAIQEYNKKRYDLIITDLTMPKKDGISLIGDILKLNESQHIVVMTAHNTTENLRNSIDFQIDGILLKPVGMDKLFQLLYKVCHTISIEAKDYIKSSEDRRDKNILQNNEQILLLVVVDKFYDIAKEFGDIVKDSIIDTVEEHLSHFGIEQRSVKKLHDDTIICSIDKFYQSSILESLQDFSDRHNILIVEFNNMKIFITISYGVILPKKTNNLELKNRYVLEHIDNIIAEIKSDAHSTHIAKIDIDLKEVKKMESLKWLKTTIDALEKETIVPFYQPMVDINTMQKVSYEVYSRIKQDNKYILPEFFIDLSAKAGILEDISKSVFDKAFKHISYTEFSFHINIGGLDLQDDVMKNYLIYLSSLYKVEHSKVVLNIMNYDLQKLSNKGLKTLLELKKLGYKIALKMFSISNINIELLTVLEPEYIKIEQVLLQKSLYDSKVKKILSFLLEYTKREAIKTILVGVESEKILNEGRKLNFDYVQGYLIKKPSDIL